jgi:hypothetical protein
MNEQQGKKLRQPVRNYLSVNVEKGDAKVLEL